MYVICTNKTTTRFARFEAAWSVHCILDKNPTKTSKYLLIIVLACFAHTHTHPFNGPFIIFLAGASYVVAEHTQPFNGRWSRTTRVGRYQKKHPPTHTHPGHRTPHQPPHPPRSTAPPAPSPRTRQLLLLKSGFEIPCLMSIIKGTIQVSRYQKGKTNLDFTEARD